MINNLNKKYLINVIKKKIILVIRINKNLLIIGKLL